MTTWLGFKDILRDIEQDKHMLYDITFRCNLSFKKKTQKNKDHIDGYQRQGYQEGGSYKGNHKIQIYRNLTRISEPIS